MHMHTYLARSTSIGMPVTGVPLHTHTHNICTHAHEHDMREHSHTPGPLDPWRTSIDMPVTGVPKSRPFSIIVGDVDVSLTVTSCTLLQDGRTWNVCVCMYVLCMHTIMYACMHTVMHVAPGWSHLECVCVYVCIMYAYNNVCMYAYSHARCSRMVAPGMCVCVCMYYVCIQ